MIRTSRRARARSLGWRRPALVLACAGLAAAGCSSSSGSSASGSGSSSPSATAAKGTANVAYASSLQFLNEKVAGPAFAKATGYTYSGRGASSGELESEIAGGEISPNVFESVGGDNITPLQPKYTKWYIPYAGTQMVVAYNPKSKYASQFKAFADGSKPLSGLFTLLQTPGLKLGRTDPNIDPQGRDFIYMLELAQSHYHLPSDTVSKILGTSDFGTASSPQIYAESSLDATLQSGQLDAASAFITQAVELHLDYIKLPAAINLGDAALAADYAKATVTITPPGKPKIDQVGIAAGDRHHDHRQADPGRDRVRQVHPVAGRPGPVQGGRVHADHPDRHRGQCGGPGGREE